MTASGNEMGVAFRVQDNKNYYYAAVNRSAGTRGIYKIVNGARTTIWEASTTVDVSTWKWVGIQGMEDRLSMYYDGWSSAIEDDEAGGAPVWYSGGIGLEKWYQAAAHYRYIQVAHSS